MGPWLGIQPRPQYAKYVRGLLSSHCVPEGTWITQYLVYIIPEFYDLVYIILEFYEVKRVHFFPVKNTLVGNTVWCPCPSLC